MKIEHFGGDIAIENDAALDEVLRMRYGDDANEFWLSGAERYPVLSILVHGTIACLHYFPGPGHAGFISVGMGGCAAAITFFTNTSTEEIEVPGDSVVPFSQAQKAAHEFLASKALPFSVKWLKL